MAVRLPFSSQKIPPWICLPRPSPTHHQTCHAWQCCRQRSLCLLQTLSHPSQVLRVHLLSSVKSTGHQWQTCQFWCSLANANRAPQCWAMSTGPTTGSHALRPPSGCVFLNVWTETFTPVACWRSFCKAVGPNLFCLVYLLSLFVKPWKPPNSWELMILQQWVHMKHYTTDY